jgi:hypothetical protein
MSERIIRASELSQYVYCAKAWWLGAIDGVKPANIHELEAGSLMHARHGQTVLLAGWAQRAAVGLLVAGVVLAIIWFAGGAG